VKRETANCIQKQEWFKTPSGTSRRLYIIIVFQGGDDGRGYIIEIYVKYPRGVT
jgi:hypothetical protein